MQHISLKEKITTQSEKKLSEREIIHEYKKINNNKKYIYQGKEWAWIAIKRLGKVTSHCFVPWENRFDWKEKGIEPIKFNER